MLLEAAKPLGMRELAHTAAPSGCPWQSLPHTFSFWRPGRVLV